MAGSNPEAALKRLGQRRRRHRTEDEHLADEIRQAIAAARNEGVPMTKVSELLGIDRTQLYRTYLPHG